MTIAKIPTGVTPDNMANFGLLGLVSNINAYAQQKANVTTSGTAVALTAAQFLAGLLILGAGASGGFTINLPSTAALIAGLGPTIPTDGSFSMPIKIQNNAVGQTGTITAGDANTTLNGTMTLATSTTRNFLLTVTGPNSVVIDNMGTMGL